MMRALGAAGLLIAAAWAGSPAHADGASLVDATPSITLDGNARREVRPDLATVTLGVVTDRATASQASADNATTAAALVAVARESGLKDADIQTSEIRLAAITDSRDGSKIRTYRASNRVVVRLRDLSKVGPLLGAMTAKGANTIDDIDFSIEKPGPVLDDLRGLATKDAARKAKIFADAAGVKLGRVLRIAPESVAPRPLARAHKMRMSEGAMAPAPPPPVEAGSETLEASVQITWELVP